MTSATIIRLAAFFQFRPQINYGNPNAKLGGCLLNNKETTIIPAEEQDLVMQATHENRIWTVVENNAAWNIIPGLLGIVGGRLGLWTIAGYIATELPVPKAILIEQLSGPMPRHWNEFHQKGNNPQKP